MWHGISLESPWIYPGTSLIAYPWNGSAHTGINNKITLPILLNTSNLKREGIMMIRNGHIDLFDVNHSWYKNNSLNSNTKHHDFNTRANGGDLKRTSINSAMRRPKIRAHEIVKPLYFGLRLYNISVGAPIFIRYHTLTSNHWTLVQLCGWCKIHIISYLHETHHWPLVVHLCGCCKMYDISYFHKQYHWQHPLISLLVTLWQQNESNPSYFPISP